MGKPPDTACSRPLKREWTLGFVMGGWVVWIIGFQIALTYGNGPTYGNDPGLSSLILFTLISLLGGAFAGRIGGTFTLR